MENQTQVFHASHRPLKIPQNQRDFHISTARACAALKSGKPKTGFPLFHPTHAMRTILPLNPKPKKGSRPLRGLLILLHSAKYSIPSCSSFDWKMLGRLSGKPYAFRIRLRYPREFPRKPQRVFDHDQHFTPDLDGHLFKDYELC